jgi:hypothetical protein
MSGYSKSEQYVYGKFNAAHLTSFARAPATFSSDEPGRAHVKNLATLTDHPTPQTPKPQDRISSQAIQALHSLHSHRNTRMRLRA